MSTGRARNVTNDLTVSVRLPWIRRTGIREAEIEDPAEPPEIFNRGDASGIGDMTFFGQYRFYNDRAARTEAAVLLGVKAPTGVTDRINNQGEPFDAEFQPGSGSWDGLFGLAYTKRFGQWSFDTNVLYMLVTNGVQDTDLGDRFLYNAAISYRLTREASAMVPTKLGALPDPMWHGGPGTHQHSRAHQEANFGIFVCDDTGGPGARRRLVTSVLRHKGGPKRICVILSACNTASGGRNER
jgi:Putative MetA-pathway of phenol degradation